MDNHHGLVGMGRSLSQWLTGSRAVTSCPTWKFQEGVSPSNHDPGSGPAQPKETMMRFYNAQHPFYGGIDLHARTMHVCVLDAAGAVVYDRNLPCHFETLLQALAPFRDGIVLGVECLFGWYWLADRCAEQHIPFVLGHALYMRLIHGGKAKN